jgi:hypothetical protein
VVEEAGLRRVATVSRLRQDVGAVTAGTVQW